MDLVRGFNLWLFYKFVSFSWKLVRIYFEISKFRVHGLNGLKVGSSLYNSSIDIDKYKAFVHFILLSSKSIQLKSLGQL